MNYIKLYILVFTSALIFSCDDVNNVIDPQTDPLIDAETAAAQNYNLTTPFYSMQVAVDSRVDRGDESVLNLLDNRAADFLDCQFPQGGAQLGFETVEIEGGEMVPPLSELRVYRRIRGWVFWLRRIRYLETRAGTPLRDGCRPQ